MKITVQIVVDAQDGSPPAVHQVGVVERSGLTPATAGLHLDEAHQVLGVLQQHLIAAQAQDVLTTGRHCPKCGRAFRHKDTRTIVVRTLFGVARIPSPRLRCHQTSRKDGWFEVVTGRSTPTGAGPSKCFAFVQTHDTKPKRRLFEVLRSQGMQDNQQITFLTDGGEDVRHLPEYLNPQATHLLDWFHITMRLTVLRQSTRTLPRTPAPGTGSEPGREASFVPDPDETDQTLERIKHYLWHGNTYRALSLLTDLVDDHECVQDPDLRQQAFLVKLAEFHGYIQANQAQIPNYGERHRCGEAISSSTAESAVNQVISRRMVKKRQMRWTPTGAHLLLQIRTRVLNNDLATDFHRWHPDLNVRAQNAAA